MDLLLVDVVVLATEAAHPLVVEDFVRKRDRICLDVDYLALVDQSVELVILELCHIKLRQNLCAKVLLDCCTL